MIGVNVGVIVAAAAASFAFGGLWYTVLSKYWLAALGRTEAELKANARPLPMLFALSIVSQLIMAWVLTGLLIHLTKAGIPANLRTGVITGAFCWLGFVATTLATNHGYQGNKWSLTLIDGAHWLGVLLIQGAMLGALGLR
jgi:Protein of unknown function (DUF1761)